MKYADWVKDKVAEIKTKREELSKELSQNIFQMLKPVFEENPEIGGIYWRQYTPYFMDGDECVFGCHIDDLDLLDTSGNEISVSWTEKQKLNKDFVEVLSLIPSDIYRDIYGDHVQITILSTGEIKKEEYEHD